MLRYSPQHTVGLSLLITLDLNHSFCHFVALLSRFDHSKSFSQVSSLVASAREPTMFLSIAFFQSYSRTLSRDEIINPFGGGIINFPFQYHQHS
jgi:hypothetical protein